MSEIARAKAVFVPASEVASGSLPVRVSQAPVTSGAEYSQEVVVFSGPDGHCAIWECEAGVYPRVKDKMGSFMYIMSGDATVRDADGTEHVLEPGSVLVTPYGWVGEWEIREPIRKMYVHSTPNLPRV